MPRVERFTQGHQTRLIQLIAGQLDAAFVNLAEVADFQVVQAFHLVVGTEAIVAQVVHAALAQVAQGLIEQGQVDQIVVQAHGQGGQLVVSDVRENLPVGAQPGSHFRNQYHLAADFLGQTHDVHARRTARTDQGEVPWVIATLHRDPANAADHVQVDQGDDADGRTFDADAQWLGDFAPDRVDGRFTIEANAAAQQRAVGQVAQGQVGVGHGGLGAALAVAHRAGVGPRAARADLKHAEVIEVGDRATTGTEGFHLDHRHADAIAQEVGVLAEVGAPGFAQGDVERGAPHVHGNDVVDTEWPCHR